MCGFSSDFYSFRKTFNESKESDVRMMLMVMAARGGDDDDCVRLPWKEDSLLSKALIVTIHMARSSEVSEKFIWWKYFLW